MSVDTHTLAGEPQPAPQEAPVVEKTQETSTPKERSSIHFKLSELLRINENPNAEYNPSKDTIDIMAEVMADQAHAFLRINAATRENYHTNMLAMFNHGQATGINQDTSRDVLLTQARKILASPAGFIAGKGAIEWEKITYQLATKAQVSRYGPRPTPHAAGDRLISHDGAHPQDEHLTLQSWIAQKRRQLATWGIYSDKAIPIPRLWHGRFSINHTVNDINLPVPNVEQGLRAVRNATRLSDFFQRRNIAGREIPIPTVRRGLARSRIRVANRVSGRDFLGNVTIPGIQPESRRIEEQARIDAQEAQRDWQTRIKNVIGLPDNAQIQFDASTTVTGDTGLSESQRLYLEAKGWRNGDRIPDEVRLNAQGEDVSVQNQIKTRLARITDAQIEIAIGTGRAEHNIVSELNLVEVTDDGVRTIVQGLTEDHYRDQTLGNNASETASQAVEVFSDRFMARADREIARAQESTQVAMPEVIQNRLDKLSKPRVLSSAEEVQKATVKSQLEAAQIQLKQAEQSLGLRDRLAQIRVTRENLDRTIGQGIIEIHETQLPEMRAQIAQITQDLGVNAINRQDVKDGLVRIDTIIGKQGRTAVPERLIEQQIELQTRQQALAEELGRLTSQKTQAEAAEKRLVQRLAETTIDEAKGEESQPETFEELLKQRTTLMNREAALAGGATDEGVINTLRQEIVQLTRQLEEYEKPATAINQMEIDSYEAAKKVFNDITEVRNRGIWARTRGQQEQFNQADTAPVHRNLPPVYARMMQVLGGVDILSTERMTDYKQLSLLFSTEDFLQTWNQANPTARIDSIYDNALFNLGLDSVNAGLVDRTITIIERRVRAGEVGIRDKQGQTDVIDQQERTHYQAIYNLRHSDRSRAARPVVYEVSGDPRIEDGEVITVTDNDIVSVENGIAQYRDIYDLARILIVADGNNDFSSEAIMLQWLRVAEQIDQRRQRIANGQLSVSARLAPPNLPLQP